MPLSAVLPGIPVVRQSPAVGEHLQDHLQLRLIYRLHSDTHATLNTLYASRYRRLRMVMEYVCKQTGPLSMAPSQLGAFISSDLHTLGSHSGLSIDTSSPGIASDPVSPSQLRPDLQYHVQPLSLDRFGSPLHSFNAITASVCHLRPTSRGSVHIRSPHCLSPATTHITPSGTHSFNTDDSTLQNLSIQPNYLSTEHDQLIAARAILLTRHMMTSQAFRPLQPAEHAPGLTQYSSNSREDLIRAAGQIGTTIFHPVGTCRMGSDHGSDSDDECSVVNSKLQVRGINKLRVCDASIMPRITSGNTAAPAMMIAATAAELILAAAVSTSNNNK
jgi:choline dehydrogenase